MATPKQILAKTNEQVADAWVNQHRDATRPLGTGNLTVTGTQLYSYQTVIGVLIPAGLVPKAMRDKANPDHYPLAVVTTARYSMTTAKHYCLRDRALDHAGIRTLRCHALGAAAVYGTALREVIVNAVNEITGAVKKLRNVRTVWKANYLLGDIARWREDETIARKALTGVIVDNVPDKWSKPSRDALATLPTSFACDGSAAESRALLAELRATAYAAYVTLLHEKARAEQREALRQASRTGQASVRIAMYTRIADSFRGAPAARVALRRIRAEVSANEKELCDYIEKYGTLVYITEELAVSESKPYVIDAMTMYGSPAARALAGEWVDEKNHWNEGRFKEMFIRCDLPTGATPLTLLLLEKGWASHVVDAAVPAVTAAAKHDVYPSCVLIRDGMIRLRRVLHETDVIIFDGTRIRQAPSQYTEELPSCATL
jgi:hypothetical protein